MRAVALRLSEGAPKPCIWQRQEVPQARLLERRSCVSHEVHINDDVTEAAQRFEKVNRLDAVPLPCCYSVLKRDKRPPSGKRRLRAFQYAHLCALDIDFDEVWLVAIFENAIETSRSHNAPHGMAVIRRPETAARRLVG